MVFAESLCLRTCTTHTRRYTLPVMPSCAHAGAVVASSNAALALVQLGDEPAAIKEMQKASRRAPGSADLRAALAALYWSQVPAICRMNMAACVYHASSVKQET